MGTRFLRFMGHLSSAFSGGMAGFRFSIRIQIPYYAGHTEQLGAHPVHVHHAQLQAAFGVVNVRQLRHYLKGALFRGFGVVKIHGALNAQPLAPVVGRADLDVGIVQNLLIGRLVLADGEIQPALVLHGKAKRPHTGLVPLHGGKIEGGILFQKRHDLFHNKTSLVLAPYRVRNRYWVVSLYSSPGRRMALGNCGRLGLQG